MKTTRKKRWTRAGGLALLLALILVVVWWVSVPAPVNERDPEEPIDPGQAQAIVPGDGGIAPTAGGVVPAAETYHMRLIRFSIDADGLRAGPGEVVAGRVKAALSSHARERLEYVFLDPSGSPVYSGSMDHPLRPSFEVAADDDSGELRRIHGRLTENEFLLRVPAEINVARIEFAEVVIDEAGGQPVRRVLGEFVP